MDKPQLNEIVDNEWEFVFPLKMQAVSEDFWDAVELIDNDIVNAEKNLKKIITKFPYHIDAYNHLSIVFSNQKKYFESQITAEKAYNIGKECFKNNFDFENGKIRWVGLNNRPFLRSCQILGLEYQRIKEYDKALSLYEEALKYNPNDNQGLRSSALECHFLKKDFLNVKNLLDKYSDDYSIDFLVAKVIINITDNNNNLAIKNLEEVKKQNKYIVKVIKKENIKSEKDEFRSNFGIAVGSLQEAEDYYKRNSTIFKLKKVADFFNT